MNKLTKRLLLLALLVITVFSIKVIDNRYPWGWAYIMDQLHPVPEAQTKPVHVMFTFVDHFKPRDQASMNLWVNDYPEMAKKHQDADGRFPQHTWFWYFGATGDGQSSNFLRQLSKLSYDGFGEVELHLHHYNDNEQTWLEKMNRMIELSQATGAMITAGKNPQTRFAFIHGMWALDNSRNGQQCGVNNEIQLLKRLGCFADFTHPSWGPMHPRIVNRLYYVTDDPKLPKSYDSGQLMEVGNRETGDLLIFEGPSVVRLDGLKPVYDNGAVTMIDLPSNERVDDWVATGIHVRGRPEWVFVKVYTHGIVERDYEAVLGKHRDQMHDYLESQYNDGINYTLHYVTAREAYNIAKAAEEGKSGDPNQYRDYAVAAYANRYLVASVPYQLISIDDEEIIARFLVKPGTVVNVQVKSHDIGVEGSALVQSIERDDEETRITLVIQDERLVHFVKGGYSEQLAQTLNRELNE